MKGDLVDQLLKSYDEVGAINRLDRCQLPSQEKVARLLSKLNELLFPGYFEEVDLSQDELPRVTEEKVQVIVSELSPEIYKCLKWYAIEQLGDRPRDDLYEQSEELACALLQYIPELRLILKDDIAAIYGGDPAAQSEAEIILGYPGFFAITTYRIAHFLHQRNVPLIPRMMTAIAHRDTGVDIHPAATIGRHFCIDHGTGIVIGETTEIGDHVKLYQGVTLGALSVGKKNATEKRHPTIEDHVTIYARTTILGGKTVIGHHTVIGGNVWITSSVPAHSKLYLNAELKQERRTRSQ